MTPSKNTTTAQTPETSKIKHPNKWFKPKSTIWGCTLIFLSLFTTWIPYEEFMDFFYYDEDMLCDWEYFALEQKLTLTFSFVIIYRELTIRSILYALIIVTIECFRSTNLTPALSFIVLSTIFILAFPLVQIIELVLQQITQTLKTRTKNHTINT